MSKYEKAGRAEITRKVNADGVECIELVSTILQDNVLGRVMIPYVDLKKIAKIKLGHSVIL